MIGKLLNSASLDSCPDKSKSWELDRVPSQEVIVLKDVILACVW